MTDTFSKIKEELSLYYPDITDDEVNKLIRFFKLSAKAIYEAKKVKTEDLSSGETTSCP